MYPMDITTAFIQTYHCDPSVIARAPGRVNLLGEHVDYNDGLVLPAAIDRQVNLAASESDDQIITIHALDLGKKISFRTSDLDKRIDLEGKTLSGWELYPAGVAWSLVREGFVPSGSKAVFSSNIPIGSGLSSSAAVEVGFAVTWRFMNGWKIPPMRLAQICQRAENDYVGVSCGLMDQFASTCGVVDHALCFDVRDLVWEKAPLPPGTSLVIADSGVRRSLKNSAYNARRASCEQAVEELRHYLPNIHSLRDVLPTEFAAYSQYLSPEPRLRAEHIVKEIARVRSAMQALRSNNPTSFGALMYSGHASLRDLYEVSIPELDILVEITRHLPGVYGARLTGAGFGGCTINLVEEKETDQFVVILRKEYMHKTGKQAQVYVCHASQGASASVSHP
ncbi:MAG: galactokinase [Chloroflexi bacterium RBG_16_54_18]|nr:MAG: galactokinase [Chloroflexi bacterium RBG_16_54_18]